MKGALALLALLAVSCGHFNPTASGARVVSPSPTAISTPVNIQLSAPTASVVWALVDYYHLYRSNDQGGHWEQRPAADRGRFASFLNDREGWVLSPGAAASQCEVEVPAIWHTTDAGATWHQLAGAGIAKGQCKSGIWFTDAAHGFVSAWDPNHRPTLYRTSDGGGSWTASTLPDPAYFKSSAGGFTLSVLWVKQFGSALFLEAFGSQDDPNLPHDNQFILMSSDGGAAWTYVTKVASRSTVMVTPMRWLDLSNPGQSFESINGGQQFHQFATDFNSDAPGQTSFVFADDQVGYASAGGLLQRTLDGGTHWTRINTPGLTASPAPMPSLPPGTIPMPGDVQLSAPSTGVVWALVVNQYLFRSSDQGKTWQQRNWVSTADAGSVLMSFVDETNGWALVLGVPAAQCAQQGAQLWRTTDGAQTWKMVFVAKYGQVSPNGFSLEMCKDAMHFEDPQHGFIAVSGTGNPLAIFRTIDGGLSWSYASLPYPPPGNPSDVVVASIKGFGDTVLAAARNSYAHYVYVSADRGLSWSVQATLPQDMASNVAFLGPLHWLIVQPGEESADGGSTWHAFTVHDEEAAGVASTFVFADDKLGYGTVRGDLRRTVDGGANFVLIKNSWP